MDVRLIYWKLKGMMKINQELEIYDCYYHSKVTEREIRWQHVHIRLKLSQR